MEGGRRVGSGVATVADVDTAVVDGILRAALARDAEVSRPALGQIGTSAEDLRFSGQIPVQHQ